MNPGPTTSAPTAAPLRAALDALLDGLPPRRAAAAVDRLMAGYRNREAPVLRDRADAVAYAAYRMPATFEAVAAALRQLAARLPGWVPDGHLDLGGGTGAAAWAAAAVWPAANAPGTGRGERPTLVLDRAGPALDLGRELAARAPDPHLRAAEWRRASLDAPGPLPPAGLVTASYVLNELAPPARDALVDAAAAAGTAVVLVEPGTPDGYLRVRAARDRLIAAGLTVLAPCPHDAACPITPGEDWCHVAARVGRSALHRRVKGGVLPYEDEKFAYVAAARPAVTGTGEGPEARVVRRPLLRKGLVLLDLCTREDGLRRQAVSKRHGADYRAARAAEWGAPWPPDRDGERDHELGHPGRHDYPSRPATGQDERETRGGETAAE
ncbi:small ribosomal subunit Rsm22 family protein [Streptomyces sp. DSM 44917]|uniref:Small ribosomal subunit Rsm22 family protein n=1 Tax=Streptomyces boetiae TaxID=3075541 RepID=A0ABU2L3R0_9ACTN|nr:small ribosomal subunit Rsm22 family protein [Streptomyces sp. DSM 44917]MDT0306201.1 small ribosomal subunit Rsm22 family protein [Streptomyces sp. DSM 44917]